MKIVIGEILAYFVDLDAPVLGATEVTVGGRVLWRVWCKHCRRRHCRGPAAGHREAHCRTMTP